VKPAEVLLEEAKKKKELKMLARKTAAQ